MNKRSRDDSRYGRRERERVKEQSLKLQLWKSIFEINFSTCADLNSALNLLSTFMLSCRYECYRVAYFKRPHWYHMVQIFEPFSCLFWAHFSIIFGIFSFCICWVCILYCTMYTYHHLKIEPATRVKRKESARLRRMWIKANLRANTNDSIAPKDFWSWKTVCVCV